jgi:hypothetical protein
VKSKEPDNKQGLSLVPLVVPAYQRETSGLVGGAAILVYQHPKAANRRDSQVTLAATASLKKQFSVLLLPDLFLLGDALHISGTGSASHFPDTYYGVGNNTRKADAEPYTANFYEGEVSPKLRLFRGMYAGPTVRMQWTELAEVRPGGLLDRQTTVGYGGGHTNQVGLSAFHDSRDETLYPRRGHIVKTVLRFARHELASDYDFTVFRLDARQYFSTYGRHVLAFQAVVELRAGSPPFYELSRMGGYEIMRGYFEGRFRGRDYAAGQAEYRFPLFWRVGAVAFASAGRVAQSLEQVNIKGIRGAGGAGIRLAPFADVPVNLRLDVAYGNEPSVYLNVGEAF